MGWCKMDKLLTVQEVVELTGLTRQTIDYRIKKGKIQAIVTMNEKNRKKYLIPLESLDIETQELYYSTRNTLETVDNTKIAKPDNSVNEVKAFDEYTAEEREMIIFWKELINEWQTHRQSYKNKGEADSVFVTIKKDYFLKNNVNVNISETILYRKQKAIKENDLQALLDNRGKWKKGKTSLSEKAQEVFEFYYLDQNKPPVTKAVDYTKLWFKEFYPDELLTLPSERVFRRYIDKIPQLAILCGREGQKTAFDKGGLYFERQYDNLEANDVWIADNHTWDLMTLDEETGKPHRLYITAFLDAKSGVMVGWCITEVPCAQATVYALRHSIQRFGIPKIVYFDNGREFLTHDVGGRGNRTLKKNALIEHPPTILQRLDIKMVNAIVKNAKAKPIERTFYTFKNTFSKLFESYCGGTIAERPERHSKIIKSGKITSDSEFKEMIATMIDGEYNLQEYGGCEKRYKGMSRLDVWNKSIKNTVYRTASEDDLNLMLMRSTEYQKVGRKGVYVTLSGKKHYYMNDKTWERFGEEVYVRYDPEDIRTVRIYDKEDRYLETLPLEDKLIADYIEENQEVLSQGMQKIGVHKKNIVKRAEKSKTNLSPEHKISALDLMLRKSHGMLEFAVPTQPNVISIHKFGEEGAEPINLPMASGSNVIDINIDRMIQRQTDRRD